MRGNFLKTSERYDFSPVLMPSQKGDEVESAKTAGIDVNGTAFQPQTVTLTEGGA